MNIQGRKQCMILRQPTFRLKVRIFIDDEVKDFTVALIKYEGYILGSFS